MSFLNFIDSVDWNKNIIFLIVYVSIVALCAFLYLFPIMDSYKSAIMEYRKTNILDTQINTTLTQLQTQQDSFLKDNAEIFSRLKREIDISEIRQFVASHIKDVAIDDLGVIDAKNGIRIQTLKIKGKTSDLEQIKSLIANISTLENSVRIAFPIIIYKKGNTFFIEMNLQIYNAESNANVDAKNNIDIKDSESVESNADSAK